MPKQKDLIKLKSSPVTESDRLRFAIFFAIALHFIVIFGVQFVLPSAESSSTPLSLEVTIAHRSSLEPPTDADFIGQNNQIGAGDNKTAERPTTELEHFKSTDGQITTPSLEITPQESKVISNKSIIASKAPNDFETQQVEADPEQLEQEIEQISVVTPPPELLKQLNLEQSLHDNIATRGEKDEGISAAVLSSPDEAPYLAQWRNKVLEVGNRHYSPMASKLGNGSPKVRVVIAKDGNLLSVQLQESSGNSLLDETALEIVRIAAPYDPLPPSILKSKTTLEFARKLNFYRDNFDSSSVK